MESEAKKPEDVKPDINKLFEQFQDFQKKSSEICRTVPPCMRCGQHYLWDNVNDLEEGVSHAVCDKCGYATVIQMIEHGAALAFTELGFIDWQRAVDRAAISLDDVLAVHSLMETGRII